MSRKSQKRGEPSGEWRKVEGAEAPVDPKRVRALDKLTPGELSLAEKHKKSVAGSDPYNQVNDKPQGAGAVSRRRSLDDMLRLSDAIKTAPNWTPPRRIATTALYRRLDELRAELQRVHAEVKSLCEGSAVDAAPHMAELITQLKEGARHLEEAIAYLVPPQH